MDDERPELIPKPPRPAPQQPSGSSRGPAPPVPGAPRRIPIGALHEGYRALLPRRGVLAGGGGFVSTTWRVVVDLETAELNAARSDDHGKLVFGALDDTTRRRLPTSTLAELRALAESLLESDATPQTVLSADSMGVMIVADADRVYELMPAGPITDGPAADLVRALYGLAWSDD